MSQRSFNFALLKTVCLISLSFVVSACCHHDDAKRHPELNREEWAQRAHAHMHQMSQDVFAKMDANDDGYITRKEHASFTREWFSDADSNHDGRLTLEELESKFEADKHKMMAERWSQRDSQRDEQNDR